MPSRPRLPPVFGLRAVSAKQLRAGLRRKRARSQDEALPPWKYTAKFYEVRVPAKKDRLARALFRQTLEKTAWHGVQDHFHEFLLQRYGVDLCWSEEHEANWRGMRAVVDRVRKSGLEEAIVRRNLPVLFAFDYAPEGVRQRAPAPGVPRGAGIALAVMPDGVALSPRVYYDARSGRRVSPGPPGAAPRLLCSARLSLRDYYRAFEAADRAPAHERGRVFLRALSSRLAEKFRHGLARAFADAERLL